MRGWIAMTCVAGLCWFGGADAALAASVEAAPKQEALQPNRPEGQETNRQGLQRDQEETERAERHRELHRSKRHRGGLMGATPHQAMYMQLLAEKYTPESAGAWRQTMEERTALMKAMRELQAAGIADRAGAEERMKKFMQESGASFQAHQALIKGFTDAVEAKDDRAIREALPKLLQSEQKLNAALRKWVDAEKAEQGTRKGKRT